MRKPVTITLEGRDYLVRPLTLGAIRDIDLARTVDLPEDSRAREAFFFNLYVEVLTIALQEDHPEVTAENIFKMRIDLAEVVAAYQVVMKHSGLVSENPQKGTAEPPLTGPISTAE